MPECLPDRVACQIECMSVWHARICKIECEDIYIYICKMDTFFDEIHVSEHISRTVCHSTCQTSQQEKCQNTRQEGRQHSPKHFPAFVVDDVSGRKPDLMSSKSPFRVEFTPSKVICSEELSGFFSTSLLAHLRRAVADAFGVPFRSCQLVVRQQILHPEMDRVPTSSNVKCEKIIQKTINNMFCEKHIQSVLSWFR